MMVPPVSRNGSTGCPRHFAGVGGRGCRFRFVSGSRAITYGRDIVWMPDGKGFDTGEEPVVCILRRHRRRVLIRQRSGMHLGLRVQVHADEDAV